LIAQFAAPTLAYVTPMPEYPLEVFNTVIALTVHGVELGLNNGMPEMAA
jgi:hypothetical protein